MTFEKLKKGKGGLDLLNFSSDLRQLAKLDKLSSVQSARVIVIDLPPKVGTVLD